MGETPIRSGVAVALATFRRTEQLARLLPELARQASADIPGTSVIVVDNDPERSAAPVVSALRPAWPALEYHWEPRPGIAAARNAGIAAAAGRAAVVFIDDDEVPDPDWLATLVRRWSEWGCAAVAGPVRYEFDSPPPAWVVASGRFDMRLFGDGERMPSAPTSNLLLDLAILDRHGLRFDDTYGLTGGSDTKLSRSLIAAGEQIRWSTGALVGERVPAGRATRTWVLTRLRRSANVWARVDLELAGSPRRRVNVRASLMLNAGLRIGRGVSRIAWGALRRNLPVRASGEGYLASAVGLLQALIGRNVEEYRR